MVNKTQKLFLSFDIEADGPSPSRNSMLSIGISGLNENGQEIISYQRNIAPHPNRVVDQRTKIEFWDKNPEIYKFVTSNQVSAEQCMKEIIELYNKLKNQGYKISWIARPAAYDWQWLNSYYHDFGPEDKPWIGFKATCISTALDIYSKINNLSNEAWDQLIVELSQGEKMTHNPLDDARYQARVYYNLMKKFGISM